MLLMGTNIKCNTVQRESLAGQKFGEFTRFEHLAKKVWRMNRFSQKVIIVSRNLDDFSWQIRDDSPNLPNILPAKLSCYTVCSYLTSKENS